MPSPRPRTMVIMALLDDGVGAQMRGLFPVLEQSGDGGREIRRGFLEAVACLGMSRPELGAVGERSTGQVEGAA